MGRDRVVRILFVEREASAWLRAEAFFAHQLSLVGARPDLHCRLHLPDRVAGFDLVSLDGRHLISALLARPGLLADLRRTAIVNLHAEAPGPIYGDLRLLLDRHDEHADADGLWVFPQSWMAPWFTEPLEFPELGLVTGTVPARRTAPDRTWERRATRPAQWFPDPFVSAPAKG